MAKTKGKGSRPPKPSRARKKPAKRRPVKRSKSEQDRRPAKHQEKVDAAIVRLEAGKGSAGRGGGSGGHYWHIHLAETRVGYVYINVLDEAPFGKHASIQIHINQTHRGRGIGSVAYRLACEKSSHDEVIATMRQSNVASQRAAVQAGFKVIDDMKIPQLAMRWNRLQKH
jgi:L-amino acid N-acyltransferase YncA